MGTRRGRNRRMVGVDDRWLHAIQCHCVVAATRNVDDYSPIAMLHHSVWPVVLPGRMGRESYHGGHGRG